MNEKQAHRVFLSYSHQDAAWVREFASTLKASGISAWTDDDILPGDNWRDAIEQALRDSNTLIMVLGPDTVGSPWIYFELGAAIADRKKIIPVFIGDIDINKVPLFVRQFQGLKADSPKEAGLKVVQVMDFDDLAKDTKHALVSGI